MLDLNLFWLFVIIISSSIELIVLKLVLDELSLLKSNKLTVNMHLIAMITVVTVLTLMKVDANIKLVIGIMLGILFYKYNYEVEITRAIFITLIFWMLLLGIDSMCIMITAMINSVNDISKLLENNIIRFKMILFSKPLDFLIIPIIKSIKLKSNIRIKNLIYILWPVIGNLSSIALIFGLLFKYKNLTTIENFIILIVCFIVLLSNFSLINIIGKMIKDNDLKLENKMIKEKMDMQYKYYLNLQESQEKTKKLYHDMNNHIICIKNLHGDIDITNEYIEELNSQLKNCIPMFNTNNLILDVILNDKSLICKKYNIKFIADVNFPKYDFVDMADTCSIFSNMIDNAIEACNKIDSKTLSKQIKLRGSTVNNFFVVVCENTKQNDIISKNGVIKTDKKQTSLHGIGISSIKTSVEKYNGNMDITYSDDKFSLTLYIPLIKNKAQLSI
ncbi:MAG: GHKL domain-containing protein [Romboutsia sp.]|uniref:GHKL domain-containing protein n=1 Tax=Romboutsia sp. TaxID=1965302 RepID=UPI003F365D62